MQLRLAAILCSLTFAVGAPALAHHSFAMYDDHNTIDIEGVVKEFKLTTPHSYIAVTVTGADGSSQVWGLEGSSANSLVRDGWTKTTLKPGDEIKAKIAPLRSGAPGGAWEVKDTTFRDGTPIVRH
jgi:hypothetical protein